MNVHIEYLWFLFCIHVTYHAELSQLQDILYKE